MNTSALRSFAQYARTLLKEGVERRLLYWGFDKKGANTEAVQPVQGGYIFRGKAGNDATVPPKWNKLKAAVEGTGFDEVVERAAYTWFNRLIALKILGKNGYDTAQLDYLTPNTHTPALLERARRGQYNFLTASEKSRLQAVLADYEAEGEAFAILLIGYCHQQPLLQGIFGAIDDFTELLLPDDILTENGFLYYLNTTGVIGDEDYKQVELIGWLYQFYISEKKDEIFAGFKQNRKAEAKDIPAATQIFTPAWIVKYMVQNTLGRTWLDAHPDSELKKDWKYLVEPANTGKQGADSDNPTTNYELQTTNFLDPAVGSGHILVEAFDTLYPMYMAEYYSPEEAAQSILEHNLFGLDLDPRAVGLAQFAVILKAAQYSRHVLGGKTLPHIYAMPERRYFTKEEVALFLGEAHKAYAGQLYKALQVMEEAQNLGSIMVLDLSEEARAAIKERLLYWQNGAALTLEEEIVKRVFPAYVPILLILTDKFSCIAANPPYMGQKNMNGGLKNYVNKHYPLTKSDLFAVFMDVCSNLLQKGGRYSMINMQSWMFLGSYAEFRERLLNVNTVESMLHLGPRTFDEVSGEIVQNTAFVIKMEWSKIGTGIYYRLVEGRNSGEKDFLFRKKSNEFAGIHQSNFSKIPGSPIAYWVTSKMISLFEKNQLIRDIGTARNGMTTGENEKFLRSWFEVNLNNTYLIDDTKDFKISGQKWVPYRKGGPVKKWYGNLELVVDWAGNGKALRNNANSILRNPTFYFLKGITWSLTSSSFFAARATVYRGAFDVNGMTLFLDEGIHGYALAFLNTHISNAILKFINPTMAFQAGDIEALPFILVGKKEKENIETLSIESISLARHDWDSRETSWDFKTNPLIAPNQKNLEQSYHHWLQKASKDFFQLHANEESLNRIFIDIYGLQEELTPDVPLKDITILQEELDYEALAQMQKPYYGQTVPVHASVVMEQLISFFIGCYMGRYRLDKPGLHIAHPAPTEEELQPYIVTDTTGRQHTFEIDDDGIIPLMGGGAFTDDAVARVREALTAIWGGDTLTANLNFLQQQLGKDLEEYLVKDFWKYHTSVYSKKPIYWLFASKKRSFGVLVYMHRMNAYTPARIRSKYLIPHINSLQKKVNDMLVNAAGYSRTELKKLELLRKGLADCEEYDLLLKDIADRQISFDLDDGVTKNYAKFRGVVAEIK